MMATNARLPSETELNEYLKTKTPGIIPIGGTPEGRVVVEPSLNQIALRFPASSDELGIENYENLRVGVVVEDGVRWLELVVREQGNVSEILAVFAALTDRVLDDHVSFELAIQDVLDSLDQMLAERRCLSKNSQVGLFGELVVFLALVKHASVDSALESWKGPKSEEHDFVTPTTDFEVKTTTSERRQHWITSLTQLVPTPHRALQLLSIQLTAAGGKNDGKTLPELVEAARKAVLKRVTPLNELLKLAGYKDQDASLYKTRWVLRTPAVFFPVDATFPKLMQAHIDQHVPSPSAVIEVHYRLDVTTRQIGETLFEVKLPTD